MKNGIEAEKQLSDYSIAPPTSEDAAAIGPMHLQSWLETCQNSELGVDEDWIKNSVGYIADDSGTEFRRELFKRVAEGDPDIFYRVAKDEHGDVVGFVMATKTGEPNRSNNLEALYLLQRAQGRGLGAELMSQALGWLGQEKPIKLGVISYNDKAIDFYKKFGFELTGVRLPFKEPVEAVEMVKR